MAQTKKQPESDESPGAPEWMVTFSDCMTLLLTFFVLLLSFSSFDDKVFRKMETALAQALPSVGTSISRDREAILPAKQIIYKKELDKGSEKPTLQGEIEGSPKEDIELLDFHNRKVFIIPSNEIFWGKGTAISANGREILSDIASFMMEIPNRIIISENNPKAPERSQDISLERALTVMKYLAKKGLDKKRLCISSASTVSKQNLPKSKDDRILEITILQRSIYD